MSDSAEPIYRPGRVIAGRYRITSPLSQGGMGAVYLAHQVSLGRDVALKVMLERGQDPELVKRFDVEARAVCQLKHPNIITYHDYGRDDDGHPYLVMEYLAGYPGTKLVYGERRPGLLDLARVIIQVCSALHEAHTKGIIHRDLKWSNVMICPQSHDPVFAKLIDFGIMKVATDGSSGDQRAMTRTGMLLGTPEYMSPEAICGMPIDGRADQYSLAIMLWEAIEGHRPFDGASHFELLRQQVQEAPPPFEAAAELVATYPEIEAVVLRAMEKHPDDRYADILEFQRALMVAVGLAQPSPTSPSRPAAKAARNASAQTPALVPARAKNTGMPSSRTRLPAAALESPQPIDTRVKTGQQRPDKVQRKLHWAWLAAGFLVFVGIGFGAVVAMTGGKAEPAETADTKAIVAPDSPAPEAPKAAEKAGGTAAEGDTAVAGKPPEKSPEPTRVATEVVQPEVVQPEVSVAAVVPTTPDATTVSAPADTVADTTPVETAEAVPEKPQPLAPGRLFVQVDPWGNLSIDGRTVGRAPFDGELKPGMHTVTVTNNYFKGQHTFRVKVESGKRVARTIVLEQHLDRIE